MSTSCQLGASMTEILVASITLLGTLAVCVVGFWQWRKGQMRETSKAYRTRRAEALTAVWEGLMKADEEIRSSVDSSLREGRPIVHLDHIKNVNLLLLKESPFLLEDEREWSVTIIRHIVEIDTLVRADSNVARRVEGWWGITMGQPPGSSMAARAAYELNQCIAKFARRYSGVLSERHE